MTYKTITLELLASRPRLREMLQQQRLMLATVNYFAGELKTCHETWTQTLGRTRPGSDPAQLASEAMELAVEEIQARLPTGSQLNEGTLSLEETLRRLGVPSSGD